MGKLIFLEDKKQLQLRNSFVDILDKSWKISPNNFITFAKEEVTFKDFSITNEEQSLSMEGTISNDEDEECIVNVDNFNIENINPAP